MKNILHRFVRNFSYFTWLVRVFFEKRIIQWKIRPFYNPRLWSTSDPIDQSSRDQIILTVVVDYEEGKTQEQFESTLRSLLNQSNPHWRCLVDRRWKVDMPDPRLIVRSSTADHFFPPENLAGIPGAYALFLQPGDEMAPGFVQRIGSADGDILYFDQVVARDRREVVLLKPQWSPELWLNVDILYAAAFCVQHLRKVVQSNPPDVIAEAVRSAQSIVHLPGVFIRSRQFPWENAALRNRHKQVVSALIHDLSGLTCQIRERPNGSLSILWKPDNRKVSIIIPNRDHYEDIRTCLESLYSITDYADYEVVIVDDSSQDERVQKIYSTYAAKYANFSVIPGVRPFNFSQACNRGAEIAKGDYFLFLNNDIEIIDQHWLTNLAGILQMPGVGAAGAKLLYPDGSVQHAGIVIGLEGHASHVFMGAKSDIYTPYGYVDWMRNVSAVTGACVMIRRDVFEHVGGFDQSLALAFGDVDLCLRIIDAGYRIVYNPDVRLIHYEGRSRGKHIPRQDFLAKRDYFREKIRQSDPCYNPNLSRAWRIPTIRQRWEMNPVYRYDRIIEYKTR